MRRPAVLARDTLLVDEREPVGGRLPNWEFRAAQSGVALPRPARMRRFGQSNIEGLGVALGRNALADGRLVRPFPLAPVPSDYALWSVCPEAALDRRIIRVFHDWVFAEANATANVKTG